jgi:hypothetical protein
VLGVSDTSPNPSGRSRVGSEFQCWFWFTPLTLFFLLTRIVHSMNVTNSVWLNEINVFI